MALLLLQIYAQLDGKMERNLDGWTRHRQDIDKTQTRQRQDKDKTQTRHGQDIDNTQKRHRQDIDKT